MTIKTFLFNVSRYIGLLIIVYIAFCMLCLGMSIHDDLSISQDLKNTFWNSKERKDGQNIIAIISPLRQGELNQAEMVKKAAEDMGHLVYLYSVSDEDMVSFLPLKYMNEILISILNYAFKPDLHLAISFHISIDLPEPKIMYISVPPDFLIDKINKNLAHIQNYKSFIDINLIHSSEDKLTPVMGREIHTYPAIVGIPANQYQSSDRQKLIFFGSLWGRKSNDFYQALRKLAAQDYMFFIRHPAVILGINDIQNFTNKAKTFIDLQKTLNNHGIVLCVHSKTHNNNSIPSSRIFETISSGAIAISDMNPFIMKHFGDNILYFDSSLSEEEIYQQIDNHVHWVQQNPKKAELMAQKAHQILQQKFTTEIFVQRLLDIYK